MLLKFEYKFWAFLAKEVLPYIYHICESIDAILKDVSVTKGLFNAKVLIKRSSFIAWKLMVVGQVKLG